MLPVSLSLAQQFCTSHAECQVVAYTKNGHKATLNVRAGEYSLSVKKPLMIMQTENDTLQLRLRF